MVQSSKEVPQLVTNKCFNHRKLFSSKIIWSYEVQIVHLSIENEKSTFAIKIYKKNIHFGFEKLYYLY